MQTTINLKNRKINIEVKKLSFLQQISGLMFKTRNSPNLFFQFTNQNASIHSLFVFFPFVAVWLNNKNKVTDIGIVKPFTLIANPKSPSGKLIEIPINSKNRKIIELLVGKGKV